MRKMTDSSSASRRFLVGIATAALLLTAIALVFALSGYRFKPSPEAEVRQAVEDIRSRVSSISLQESHVVFKNVSAPKFQYRLTINPERVDGGASQKREPGNPGSGASPASVYLFGKYKYILKTQGDEDKIPTASLCEMVDAIYDRKDPILEALRELKLSGKISFPIWGALGGELEAGNLTPIVVETLYSVRKFEEIRSTHVEIMVRGYADGQHGYWDAPMEANYKYDSIPVYPPSGAHPDDSNVFLKEERPIPAHDPRNRYKNENLPDLRAHYVKEALIEPYFDLCRHFHPEAHVLKGAEFKDRLDHPEERKVQVFILIYDNTPSE